ncbi:oxygen-independent coproporphyrinogen III oxidase [Alcaligenaceae bacterium LF4-65]|uniref:Coproporphyrinogen-III oxidase n=1 Tax=Zwartia hollandica TaxID=324606 RepID=A0A953T5D1_9BURK|nr:oxygen-independent coproporphyrinogen III oxidase [Zwartia hollandica]MBZ1351501.1 oxygen-independent coproporphyrinogen III oxidase [Zwartia hollandica]
MHAASLSQVKFDADLIVRYEGSGPRYTSYPTADRFVEGGVVQQYEHALSLRHETIAEAPLSLYIHVPFCDTVCYYCACNKIATKDRARADLYLDYLQKEILLVRSRFAKAPSVSQLHLGGGTPTFLTNVQLDKLMQMLQASFELLPAAECSIEIDPRRLNAGALTLLSKHGFNRMSLGVQDLDPAVQKAVNRIQPAELTATVLSEARSLGFGSINIDLIYGLPLQSTETMRATLATVLQWRPDRIALYSYAHLPKRFMPQRRIEVSALPSGATKLAMLKLAVDTLLAAGYVYIGMDHFALPEDELAQALEHGTLQRNFQGYATQADCDLIALGVSAISRVGNTYAQNHRLLTDYYEALDRNDLPLSKGLTMTNDDEIRRAAIHDLLCQSEINIPIFERSWNIGFTEYFDQELEQLQSLAADGLVSLNESEIRITPRGRFLARIVAMRFDRHLRDAKTHAQYSKVI